MIASSYREAHVGTTGRIPAGGRVRKTSTSHRLARFFSLLLVAMLGLYFMANYNMAIFQRHVAPFDVYAAYYRPEVQSVLLAIKNAFQSLNIVLFVLYLVLLVQSQHHEKERIASLNKQLEEANVRLRAYALEAERTAETRERNRLAREIHDTLGHTLTGIAAGLDACIVLVDAAPAVVKKQLEKIVQ